MLNEEVPREVLFSLCSVPDYNYASSLDLSEGTSKSKACVTRLIRFFFFKNDLITKR